MKKRELHIRTPRIGLLMSIVLATLSTNAMADTKVPVLMQVPAGNAIAWNAPATGHITYVCRTSPTDATKPVWTVGSASATLGDRSGNLSGTYTSPPETWKSADGSTLTGLEIVRVRSGTERLYDQLVMANPSIGVGLLTGVTYIQRLVDTGGAPPHKPCTSSNVGDQEEVAYQAEYVFWKPN